MKQLLVISGKGGTGKTSIVSSFASLVSNAVLCDTDVDAADLHLILKPQIIENDEFISGYEAEINQDICIGCGKCRDLCRFDAIKNIDKQYRVLEISCEGCGVCEWNCPVNAIKLNDCLCGHSYVSNTRYGKMTHAKLLPGADNSGKLVSLVRNKAIEIAKEDNIPYIIIDGPPGIGCPVIASMTGTDLILVVTEPTLSGIHDMLRVIQLARKFDIESMVCINKFDININASNDIINNCKEIGVDVIGKIPYDKDFTKAQIQEKSIIEYTNNNLTDTIKEMWSTILIKLNKEI